jgi:hypothetical protein
VKHNRRRWLPLTEARARTVRAIRAWRNLLPDWTPTLDMVRELENMPREHRAAVTAISYGWPDDDARWDVLVALLEWERREERNRCWMADVVAETGMEVGEEFVSMDEEHERLRLDSEVTVETPMPGMKILQQQYDRFEDLVRTTQPVEASTPTRPKKVVQLVPKEGTPRVFTVRTLRSMSMEHHPCGCVGLTHQSDCTGEYPYE